MITATNSDKQQWVKWLEGYDKGELFDSLIRSIQNVKSQCVHCGEDIYCDIVEGGGVPDWGTRFDDFGDGLDYGCIASPDTTDEGTGGHEPVKE